MKRYDPTKELPPDQTLVIIQRKGEVVSAGIYDDEEWLDLNEGVCGELVDDVVFWMLLPEAKKEGS